MGHLQTHAMKPPLQIPPAAHQQGHRPRRCSGMLSLEQEQWKKVRRKKDEKRIHKANLERAWFV